MLADQKQKKVGQKYFLGSLYQPNAFFSLDFVASGWYKLPKKYFYPMISDFVCDRYVMTRKLNKNVGQKYFWEVCTSQILII